LGQELRLELLTEEQVQTYVARRLGISAAPAELSALLYRRTDGNTLFVVQLLDHLLKQGFLVEAEGQWCLRDEVAAVAREIPVGLRALLLKQMETLDARTQQVLEAASVSGSRFTPAEVSAMLQGPEEEAEAICDELVRQGAVLTAQGLVTWPDGTATVQYGFRHVLYREVLYERLGMAQGARWHHLLGERLEAGYGSRARERAGALALHFERGQDGWRAVQYRQYAAEQALSRHAYTEVLEHCHRGLELLATLPESAERVTQELSLRLSLSIALAATQGYATEALADNLQQALTLCEAVEATTALVPLLAGLTRLFMMRSDRTATERLLARQRALLTQLHDATSLVLLHTQLGTAETYRAAYTQAQVHQTHALHLYDPEKHRALALRFGNDPAVTALAASGWTLLTTGLAQYRHLGSQASLTFFLSFLAETHLRQGQVAEGREVVAEALRLTDTNFDRFWEAELHRQQGNLLLAQTPPQHSAPGPEIADAEACFQQALAIARQQGAKALELRAAMSLSRLWLAQDQPHAAQGLLAEIYGGFTEGLETADLQAAQDLLARCHAYR
jgi:predicted ATPase